MSNKNFEILLENFAQEKKKKIFSLSGSELPRRRKGRESLTIAIIGPEDLSDLTREHYLRLTSRFSGCSGRTYWSEENFEDRFRNQNFGGIFLDILEVRIILDL